MSETQRISTSIALGLLGFAIYISTNMRLKNSIIRINKATLCLLPLNPTYGYILLIFSIELTLFIQRFGISNSRMNASV